jgi:hypothetical protein
LITVHPEVSKGEREIIVNTISRGLITLRRFALQRGEGTKKERDKGTKRQRHKATKKEAKVHGARQREEGAGRTAQR